MTNIQKVLELIQANPEGLDDDEITGRLGISQRQQVYQICIKLERDGLIKRDSVQKAGKRKKIHNFPVNAELEAVNRSSQSGKIAPWMKRLKALVAATGREDDDLLDEAVQDLALKVLRMENQQRSSESGGTND